MKRAVGLLASVVLTAVYTWLATTKYLAEERSDRLQRELVAARQELDQLNAEIAAARTRVEELAQTRQSARTAQHVSRKETVPASRRDSALHPAPEDVKAPLVVATRSDGALGAPANQFVGLLPVYAAAPGRHSFARVEGTSNIHDWQAQSVLVGGTASFEPGFPGVAADEIKRGPLKASVSVSIPNSSLFSVDRDGKKFSDAMDSGLHNALKTSRILFNLTSLERQEDPKDAKGEAWYTAKGGLVVAGVTNNITMPVSVSRKSDDRLEFSGGVRVKMSDFKITPPVPLLNSTLIKVGDEVRLSFVWLAAPSRH